MKSKLHPPLNGSALRVPSDTTLPSLAKRAGYLGRYGADRACRKDARKALVELNKAAVEAQGRLGMTQLATIEASLKGALVADGIETASAVSVEIATRTGVTHSKLTATAAAERLSHVENRAATYTRYDSMVSQGRLSNHEAEALKSYANADLVADIDRTNERITAHHDAIAALHDHALAGIRRATETIK